MVRTIVSALLALGPLRLFLVAQLGRLAREQSGGLMMETTMAVTMFVLVGGATMTGPSMTHRSGATVRGMGDLKRAQTQQPSKAVPLFPVSLSHLYQNLSILGRKTNKRGLFWKCVLTPEIQKRGASA